MEEGSAILERERRLPSETPVRWVRVPAADFDCWAGLGWTEPLSTARWQIVWMDWTDDILINNNRLVITIFFFFYQGEIMYHEERLRETSALFQRGPLRSALHVFSPMPKRLNLVSSRIRERGGGWAVIGPSVGLSNKELAHTYQYRVLAFG